MSRKTIHRKKRKITLEAKYHNLLLSKFIRMLMWNGKLSVAENSVYTALNLLENKFKDSAINIFQKSLDNIRPLVKVKARRVGGSTYQVPIEVSEEAGFSIAMRWIITAARNKKNADIAQKLFLEFSEAYEKRGDAFRKREETHKMAEANRAFAHYRI